MFAQLTHQKWQDKEALSRVREAGVERRVSRDRADLVESSAMRLLVPAFAREHGQMKPAHLYLGGRTHSTNALAVRAVLLAVQAQASDT